MRKEKYSLTYELWNSLQLEELDNSDIEDINNLLYLRGMIVREILLLKDNKKDFKKQLIHYNWIKQQLIDSLFIYNY